MSNPASKADLVLRSLQSFKLLLIQIRYENDLEKRPLIDKFLNDRYLAKQYKCTASVVILF